MMTDGLWKSTIIIWSEFDPQQVELSTLAREAEVGEAYCSSMAAEFIREPEQDVAWDGTSFFYERG